MNEQMLWITAITLLAATVNGALGYGFSSITVPLALLLLSNRVLNPSLVIVEVLLNAYVLWVNRDAVRRVRTLVMPIAVGLAPGVAAGALLVARVDPTHMKMATYLILLPMILVQRGAQPGRGQRYARASEVMNF